MIRSVENKRHVLFLYLFAVRCLNNVLISKPSKQKPKQPGGKLTEPSSNSSDGQDAGYCGTVRLSEWTR